MKTRVATLMLLLCLLALALPPATMGQCRDDRGFGREIRRGRNGIRIGNRGLNLFDGPGILNYEHRRRWMPGAGGAATVIGVGAGAGAATGALVQGGKKGAIIGAAIGAGSATALWLYKNRTTRRRIF
jgi:hypothetical protein